MKRVHAVSCFILTFGVTPVIATAYELSRVNHDLQVLDNKIKLENPEQLKADNVFLERLRDKYKPSKEKYGAGVTQQSGDRLPDNSEAKLIGIVDGYIDIVWDAESEITEQIKRIFKRNRIEYVSDDDENFKRVIIYRPNAEKNARLFQKYRDEIRKLRNDKKVLSYARDNDYLQGILLKYAPTDIEYYYKFNTRQTDLLDADKKAAKEWLTKNSAGELFA